MLDSNGVFHARLWHGANALAVDDVTIAPAGEEPTGAEMLAALLAAL